MKKTIGNVVISCETSRECEVTKRIKIIAALLHDNRTENQGIAESSDETAEEYVKRWFGEYCYLTGEYRENCTYLYSYLEPLSDILADAVVTDAYNQQIYLYCLD